MAALNRHVLGPWFGLALESRPAYVVMTWATPLITGYLFARCLVDADPGLKPAGVPGSVLLIIVAFGLHASFSVSLMASSQILSEHRFGLQNRLWGSFHVPEIHCVGASLDWAVGNYPLALLAVVLWVRDDKRESELFYRRGSARATPSWPVTTATSARLPAGPITQRLRLLSVSICRADGAGLGAVRPRRSTTRRR